MTEQICKKPALLVLGVDPDLAEGIRIYLEDSYDVYIVTDPADLNTHLASYHVALLLTDIDTTGINQLQQIQSIRSAYPDLKIIVMYMFLDEEERREKSVLSAADDSISKPFSASVLKYKLDQLLVPVVKQGAAVLRH
jgi:DNA-binding response OmpR family regulator